MATFYPIPLTNDARQSLEVTLGSTPLTLEVRWQPLDNYWYVDIRRSGVISVADVKLVAMVDLLRQYPWITRAIGGTLVVRAITETMLDPRTDPWGVTHQLGYIRST